MRTGTPSRGMSLSRGHGDGRHLCLHSDPDPTESVQEARSIDAEIQKSRSTGEWGIFSPEEARLCLLTPLRVGTAASSLWAESTWSLFPSLGTGQHSQTLRREATRRGAPSCLGLARPPLESGGCGSHTTVWLQTRFCGRIPGFQTD